MVRLGDHVAPHDPRGLRAPGGDTPHAGPAVVEDAGWSPVAEDGPGRVGPRRVAQPRRLRVVLAEAVGRVVPRAAAHPDVGAARGVEAVEGLRPARAAGAGPARVPRGADEVVPQAEAREPGRRARARAAAAAGDAGVVAGVVEAVPDPRDDEGRQVVEDGDDRPLGGVVGVYHRRGRPPRPPSGAGGGGRPELSPATGLCVGGACFGGSIVDGSKLYFKIYNIPLYII